MSEPLAVRPVTAAETRPLRQRILRPHQRPEQLVYPHDDAPETLHVAAFDGDAMVGTATIHLEPHPHTHAPAWRLRGMAVVPELRRRGCGARLVDACIAHVRAHGGTLVWCNARVSAAPFYDSLGFVREGDAFELPEIGPHFLMKRELGVGD